MKPDESILAPIRSAVEAAPENLALRLHLAKLLLDAGEEREALDHYEAVLAEEPENKNALKAAAAAARKLGDSAAAQRYRLRLSQTGGSAAAPVKLHAVRTARGREEPDVERPVLTLDDVGGMDHVKRRLRASFLAPLENPALRRMYGKSLRGGLLLYGPPGCGKTFVARATAGELGARFIAVGLHDVLDMWLGESERKLHELFEQARREAPCVLFFDEVDALGRKRSQLRYSGGREVVVQFLAELDSFGADNEGVFVLAATNHPWDVDAALRRPGRLDRTLLVLPPDEDARKAILALHLRERPVGDVDVDEIASRTHLYSGADLAHVCETAVEFALEDSLVTGTARPIQTADLIKAAEEVLPSTRDWLYLARNYVEFSDSSAMYDELREFLENVEL